MREKTRSVLCLLPAILGIFLFGGPVFPIDNIGQFLSDIGLKNLIQYPGYENFRGGNGSGVSDFLNLMYQNFYTFGLATFLFFTYIFYLQSKRNYNFRNFLFLLILSVLTASIDETFFPVEIIMVSFLLIVQLRHILKSKLLEVLLLLIITGLSFWLIQNPIRDSFLTPSPQLPRFKLLLETDSPLLQKIVYRKGETVRWNGKDIKQTASSLAQSTLRYLGEKQLIVNKITFYIVDFKLMAVIVLVIGLLIGSRLSVIFAVSACFSFLFAIFLVNTFWIPNNLRFANQAGQLLMFGMGVLLVDLATHKWKKIFPPFVILCLIVLTPQFLISHTKFINSAFVWSHPYFNFTNSQIDQRLAEIENIIPLNSKIIFLDAFPVNELSTYLNTSAYSRYGLFVPLFSAAPKILNPAMGMEWYDAVSTLSPYAFKTLNIDYLMVDTTAFTRLTDLQIKRINDESNFKKIKDLNKASLYKVQPNFKQLPDDGMNIKNMIFQIEPGSKVYLDRFKPGELRGILLVQLSQRVHLTGSPYAHTGEIMYIETALPFEDACKEAFCTLLESKNIKNLDYALMSSERDPNLLFDSRFKKVAAGVNVDLWKAVPEE